MPFADEEPRQLCCPQSLPFLSWPGGPLPSAVRPRWRASLSAQRALWYDQLLRTRGQHQTVLNWIPRPSPAPPLSAVRVSLAAQRERSPSQRQAAASARPGPSPSLPRQKPRETPFVSRASPRAQSKWIPKGRSSVQPRLAQAPWQNPPSVKPSEHQERTAAHSGPGSSSPSPGLRSFRLDSAGVPFRVGPSAPSTRIPTLRQSLASTCSAPSPNQPSASVRAPL
mmetsp:Transcript_4690/g.13989  ORF Transcript_4690/g.13989 Transcript_4690/m.13989 type:complete len:225 (+) Transcript_4690:1070-1744(+)